ncbi:HTH domain-containing protein [Streptosporangium album]|uniref:HTH domain-containing protein n=1 Tax=Streptosporangium album TaxID=47479 RepID=UPI003CD080BE
MSLAALARDFDLSERTISRDLERLRLSGVPVDVATGRGGGAVIDRGGSIPAIAFDLREIAAIRPISQFPTVQRVRWCHV